MCEIHFEMASLIIINEAIIKEAIESVDLYEFILSYLIYIILYTDILINSNIKMRKESLFISF